MLGLIGGLRKTYISHCVSESTTVGSTSNTFVGIIFCGKRCMIYYSSLFHIKTIFSSLYPF